MNLEKEFTRYLFEYRYENAEWGVEIVATSPEDARQRLKALSWARYQGEIKAKFYIPGSDMLSGVARCMRQLLSPLFGMEGRVSDEENFGEGYDEAATLEQRITDSNVAKSESEWWAYHEITRLREELRERDAEIDQFSGILADYKDAAASEAERANELNAENGSLREDLTWFWAIVDKEGFANVPSSELDALRILSRKASESDALREENARLREALKPFAYIAEHVGEEDARWAVPSAHLRAAAAAIREGGKE